MLKYLSRLSLLLALATILAAIVALVRGKPEWAMAFAGLGVAGSVIVGVVQLQLTTRTQQLDFLFRIQEQFFFKEKLIKIREALDEGRIWIEVAELMPTDPPYAPPVAKTDDDLAIRGDDMDDYLSYFELVAMFLDQDLLSIDAAWEFFSHYLEMTLNHENVRYYIKWLNDYPGHTRLYYTRLDPLMKKFNEYAKRRRLLKPKGKSMEPVH
jgi:hypothetical protein